MDVNVILRILQDAQADIELVDRDPRANWRAEYAQVLKAFAALDDWISQGNPLPHVWAAHHAPDHRAPGSPTAEGFLPRPRQEPDL